MPDGRIGPMSFYTYYQAIPERCRLLERLRDEEGFCRLYTGLIPYGPGPFHLDQLDPSELDDILNDFADGERFGSREEVDGCLRGMTAELSEAVTAYPGLGKRAAFIEKQHREIEEPLSQELRCRGSEADVKLMTELLYGGEALSPTLFDPYESQLRLIPASTVAEGAKRLAGVELSEEAHDISDYACEQFRDWKGLIIKAARLGEAIIVFPTG
jgi:hypothetical protein